MASRRIVTGHTAEAENLPDKGRWRKVLMVNAVILSIAFFVMYNLFPQLTQNIVFDGIMRNGWYFVPWIILGLIVFWYNRRHDALNDVTDSRLGRHRRAIVFLVVGVVASCILNAATYSGTDYLTYKAYASSFLERKGLIASAPASVRYTPLANACNDIGHSVSSTGEHVECKYVRAILSEAGFGYVGPISPTGTFNVWWYPNKGFLYLDDSFTADADAQKRLSRIDDEQYYGPGMQWSDNIDYVLAKTDFFANYDTPHYVALNPAEPRKLTLVASKIKYGFMWRLPYWGGVVLVHSDGKVEDLSQEAALKDSRLKGQWIFPISLARRYVDLQNYKVGMGLLTPLVTVEGMLQIEPLTGNNEFPFLTKGADGKAYLVTATKGQGSAQGLFRMYYVDAWSGEASYHQFGNHEVVYGASASQKRLTNVPGYQWRREGEGGGGVAVGIEPVYIVRPNDPILYWKFTITNVNHSGISATAVVNSSRPDDIKMFPHRYEFEAWLSGNPVESTTAVKQGSGTQRDEILRTIAEVVKQLEALKRQAEGLPK